MGKFEVQGIVSSENGLPFVQIRQLDDNGDEESGGQLAPVDARELAQTIMEAAINSTYEAALMNWAKERDPEDGEKIAVMMIVGIRENRSDRWGLPDSPEDWQTKND